MTRRGFLGSLAALALLPLATQLHGIVPVQPPQAILALLRGEIGVWQGFRWIRTNELHGVEEPENVEEFRAWSLPARAF